MLRLVLRGGRAPARALARAPARWLATSPPKRGRAKSEVLAQSSGANSATPEEEEAYQRLTPHEHVLARPGMYIGSPSVVTKSTWLYDDETQRMVWRSVQFNSGLYKIFDEILVNALDNRQRDPEGTRAIDIEVDEAGRISVRNDGRGIPVRRHATEGLWVPEMILGELQTLTLALALSLTLTRWVYLLILLVLICAFRLLAILALAKRAEAFF